MKLLLDESVPKRLGSFFPDEFKMRTVQQMGWTGSSNGDLLRLASAHGFDALITVDQGIEYQQNLTHLTIPVIVMVAHQNRLQELRPLVPKVVAAVSGNLQKRISLVSG
jgi:predicted nuclease of predicted toxin-antitoxin system